MQDNPFISHKIHDIIMICPSYVNGTDFFTFLSSLKDAQRIVLTVDLLDDEVQGLPVDCQLYKTIEYISECTAYSLALGMLSKSVFPMLTTLKVFDSSDKILPLLGNAPALRRLSFWPTSISFSDLNTLHTSLTRLESLEILHAKIDSLGFDQPIEPATFVTECNFKDIGITAPKNMLEYIYNKYPNTSHLTCCVKNVVQHTQLVDGWIELFQNLGNRFKRIRYFDEAYSTNLFETLDTYQCRLDYLHLVYFKQASIQKIVDSNQVVCLQTLVLHSVIVTSFDWLQHLQALEKLKLCRTIPSNRKSTSTISLNGTLGNCPSKLTSLSFGFIDITDDFEPSNPSNTKCLSFRCSAMPDGIDAYISYHFPALSKLKLILCRKIQSKFDLSTLNLNAFHIHFSKVLISTLKNGEQRLYKCRNSGVEESDKWFKAALHYPKSYPAHQVDDIPDFTLVCLSLGKLAST